MSGRGKGYVSQRATITAISSARKAQSDENGSESSLVTQGRNDKIMKTISVELSRQDARDPETGLGSEMEAHPRHNWLRV